MMYSKKVLDHFQNPRNQGFLKNADAVGQEGNPVCGDILKVYLKFGRGKNNQEKTIRFVKFETLGCAAAIAVSSILSEMIEGMSVKKARRITKEDIIRKAGGLPMQKTHCSMLAIDALQKALKNF